jgi:hypothetical protein
MPPICCGPIDRGIRQHLQCDDARGFISDSFATWTAGLESRASDSTADALRRHSFDVAVLWSPSTRERLDFLQLNSLRPDIFSESQDPARRRNS